MITSNKLLIPASLLFSAALSIQASANTISWSGATDFMWEDDTNWTGDVAPADDHTSDTALFNLTSYPNQPDVSMTRKVKGIQIGDGSTVTAALALTSVNLDIGSGGIDMRALAGNATVEGRLTLGASQTWQNNSTNPLSVTLDGPAGPVFIGTIAFTVNGTGPVQIDRALLGTTGTLTKNGSNTLKISGSNTYTGATTIGGGTLEIAGTGRLGGGSYAGTISNDGILKFNSSATQTLSGVISGTGSLFKDGVGVITLTNANTYGGTTTVKAGTLRINGTQTGVGTIAVKSTGTLGGSSTNIAGTTTVEANGTLSPGSAAGATGNVTFTSTVDLQAGSTYAAEIASSGNDKVTAPTLTANGTIKVTLLGGYSPGANTTFDIADGTVAGTPTFDFTSAALGAGLAWETSSFTTSGTIKVVASDPFASWATARSVTEGKTGDDDDDGISNLVEFATNANPQSGSSITRAYPLVHSLSGQNVLTYTIATRSGTSFAANGSKQQADKDSVRYVVEASNDLDTWTSVNVTQLTPGDASSVQTALGARLDGLEAGWEWHTFRTDGDSASDPSEFIRLNVSESP